MNHQRQGFTLVEVTITAVITVVMMLAVMGVFEVGQEACTVGSHSLAIQFLNTRSFAEMTRTIRASRVHSISKIDPTCDPVIGPASFRINGGNGGWIKLQVPVQLSDTHPDFPIVAGDDVIDQTANLVWGAANDRKNWAVIFVFAPMETFDEDDNPVSADPIDLNRDGDTADVFSIGYIGEWLVDDPDNPTTYVPDGPPRPITSACVVMQMVDTGPGNNPAQGPGGDVDNLDGNDPLFMVVNDNGEINGYNPADPDTADQADDARRVRIALFAFRTPAPGRTILARPMTIVAPRAF
ncbi:MAG: prepilin-type N-terminal cleavage/methylation domain-containing protein [Planctomycetota bacterium]